MRPACERCAVSFRQQQDLEEHVPQVHGTEPPRYEGTLFECANCNRSYMTEEDLDLHARRTHAP